MLEMLRDKMLAASEYIILTTLVVMGGIFAIAGWRKNPYLPIAAAFMGPVGGLAGAALGGEQFGEFFAIIGTFLGTLFGPGVAVLSQDPKIVRRVAELGLEKLERTRNALAGKDEPDKKADD